MTKIVPTTTQIQLAYLLAQNEVRKAYRRLQSKFSALTRSAYRWVRRQPLVPFALCVIWLWLVGFYFWAACLITAVLIATLRVWSPNPAR